MALQANALRALGKAKAYLAEHGDQVEGAIDKVARTVDERTKGQHSTKIDKGVDKIKGYVRSNQAATQPGTTTPTVPPTVNQPVDRATYDRP